MKVVLAGKNQIAVNVLSEILKHHRPEDLHVAYVRSEMRAGDPSDIASAAERSGLEAYELGAGDVKAGFEGLVRDLKPDLILSCQFSALIGPELLREFPNRFLNIHYSLLPRYRGMSPISHALVNGEKAHGVTLHLIDEGIDTGPILFQKEFAIEGLNNLEIYNQCTQCGTELVQQHYGEILRTLADTGDVAALARAQNHREATYYPKGSFDYQSNVLSFNNVARQVERLFFAYTFPPLSYAMIEVNGKRRRIESLRPLYEKGLCHRAPGSIVEQEGKLLVATRDCWVEVRLSG